MNFQNTYCNPIKIESYPKGYEAPSHRSLADPSVLFYDGKWYMYPSYKMAYVSEDFIHWAPGLKDDPYSQNDTGLLPLTYSEIASATSCAPGRDALYAVDESMLTWWQPLPEDEEKTLTVFLYAKYKVSAARVIWRDVGIDYEKGILPGPFRYKIQVSADNQNWQSVVDKSKNEKDYKFDYEVFDTVEATHVRLVICGTPAGIEPGVISFTVFGKMDP